MDNFDSGFIYGISAGSWGSASVGTHGDKDQVINDSNGSLTWSGQYFGGLSRD